MPVTQYQIKTKEVTKKLNFSTFILIKCFYIKVNKKSRMIYKMHVKVDAEIGTLTLNCYCHISHRHISYNSCNHLFEKGKCGTFFNFLNHYFQKQSICIMPIQIWQRYAFYFLITFCVNLLCCFNCYPYASILCKLGDLEMN